MYKKHVVRRLSPTRMVGCFEFAMLAAKTALEDEKRGSQLRTWMAGQVFHIQVIPINVKESRCRCKGNALPGNEFNYGHVSAFVAEFGD